MSNKKQKKISHIQIALASLAAILLVSLVGWQAKNLKAVLLADDGTPDLLWGQAYSPNIGWINFYCDGAGHTQPENVRTDSPEKGAEAMADFCDNVAYEVSYDRSTGEFNGIAYSANYGWFDMGNGACE